MIFPKFVETTDSALIGQIELPILSFAFSDFVQVIYLADKGDEERKPSK